MIDSSNATENWITHRRLHLPTSRNFGCRARFRTCTKLTTRVSKLCYAREHLNNSVRVWLQRISTPLIEWLAQSEEEDSCCSEERVGKRL